MADPLVRRRLCCGASDGYAFAGSSGNRRLLLLEVVDGVPSDWLRRGFLSGGTSCAGRREPGEKDRDVR